MRRKTDDAAIDETRAGFFHKAANFARVRGRDGIGVYIDTPEVLCHYLPGKIEGATGDADRQDGIGRSEGAIERPKIFDARQFGAISGGRTAIFGGPNDAHAARNETCSHGSAHLTGV